MKLIITSQSKRHISYLLERYKSTEWSGPAFYQVKSDKDGFPSTWLLKGFVSLDLGDTTSTEWNGNDWTDISKDIYKKYPEYQDCFIGLIHSHHNMGAFFSSTDTTQLKEAANKVGYGSLVVASNKEPFAFAISYIDNFGRTHMIETKEIETQGPKVKPLDEWVDFADKMDKKQKKAPTLYYRNKPGITHQGTLWSHYGMNGYGKAYSPDHAPEDIMVKQFEEVEAEMTEAEADFEQGKISKKKFKKIQRKFNKASKEYTEFFGEETDEIVSWNDSFGVI